MTVADLRRSIERLAAEERPAADEVRPALASLLTLLERGEVRAAEPEEGEWRVRRWVKQGILLGFRAGQDVPSGAGEVLRFRDRDTFPTQDPNRDPEAAVRVVPGGTAVRRGAHLGPGVVVMPPAYVNVGAYVGAGSMVDSHVLVGSCAQVGARVHLSAATQLGGVLEPVGALPVIVEDDAFVGGGCGIYEGTRVGRGAVLAAGVVLTRNVPLYDLARGEVLRAAAGAPLAVPPGAVVVPGTRPARGAFAERERVQLQAPVIVKYRDEGTDRAAALEEALR